MPELSPYEWIIIASTATGLAVASLAWVIIHFLTAGTKSSAGPGARFETVRRDRVRKGNPIYESLEAGVQKLAGWNQGRDPKKLAAISQNLIVSADKLPWSAGEYLAVRQIEAVLIGLLLVVVGYFVFEDPFIAAGCGIGGFFLYLQMQIKSLEKRAKKRLQTFKQRLPFAIDLMALMMEAGASFQEAMGTVVRESKGHPIADELGQVLRDISLGRTRREALVTLQNRLKDDDVTEIVFAVNKGEELGTPLGQILRNQAEQMRLKRSQWAEKASSEAQVNIVFPGMIIMIACLLIVVAPFVIDSIQAGGE